MHTDANPALKIKSEKRDAWGNILTGTAFASVCSALLLWKHFVMPEADFGISKPVLACIGLLGLGLIAAGVRKLHRLELNPELRLANFETWVATGLFAISSLGLINPLVCAATLPVAAGLCLRSLRHTELVNRAILDSNRPKD